MRALILLGALLFANVVLNSRGFLAGHFGDGDQKAYIAAAMKVGWHGLRQYNLRGIRIESRSDSDIVQLSDSGTNDRGDMLPFWEAEGAPFYDQPLFHAPPVFPTLIMLSHSLFAGDEPYKAVLKVDIDRNEQPAQLWRIQFYYVVVPIFSNILLLLFTYLLGSALFSRPVGLLSAFLVAITPADIVASNLIWADTTLSALLTLAALLFHQALRRQSLPWAIVGGLCFGGALLTKNSASIFLIPAALYTLLQARVIKSEKTRAWRSWVCFAGFVMMAILIALPWYVKVASIFGTPFYNPSSPGISLTNAWFAFSKQRPWYTLLVGIPYQMPLYIAGYASVGMLVWRRPINPPQAFLATWFLSFLLIVTIAAVVDEMLGPDSRYMLPAYPALAILSACSLLRLYAWLQIRCGRLGAALGTSVLLCGCAAWALIIALEGLKQGEIVRPF